MSRKSKLLIFFIVLIVVMITILTYVYLYMYIIPAKIDYSKLDSNKINVQMFDNKGNIIESENSKIVTIDNIPLNVKNAFIAIEDKRFYKHKGVDYTRILGAIKHNITNKNKQGASTITQQLIKNVYLSPDKSLSRKIKEIRMAITLENSLTKDEILEKYLNILYFGSGEYGIKNAAYRFFEKNLDELTLKESAMLAGIIKSPTKYNPINNYENSLVRANIVLDTMYKNNFISYEALISAKKESPIIKNALIYNNITQKYSENVYFEASRLLNIPLDEIPYMNLNIYTFLDLDLQTELHNTIFNKDYYPTNTNNGIGILLDNKTSGIIAYDTNLNIDIVKFLRLPGSTIKPFAVYGPSFEENIVQLYTKIENNNININGYSPNNYNNYESNYETILDSIKKSYNIPAVNVLNNLGIDKSEYYLNKMNITLDKNDKNLSLALGGMTYGLSPLKISEMYMMLANGGIYSNASFIKKITTSLPSNKTTSLFEKKSIKSRVFSNTTTSKLTYALKQSTIDGTSSKLNAFKYDIASKTGTVSSLDKNFNTDIYNVSFTTKHTCLMWQGGLNKDEYLPKNFTGGGQTTTMVKDFFSKIYKDIPENFNYNDYLLDINLDKYDYDNNKYTLSDDLSPKYNIITAKIGKVDTLPDKNNSYSNIDNIEVINKDNVLSLKLDPRISYKIYKKTLFNLELITEIKNKEGYYNLKEDNSIFVKYYIIPYYYNDENNMIIGIPYKYGNTSIEQLD